MSATTNYPGWIKGVYPIRENAVTGIQNNNLFVARYEGKIVGSIILDHQPEEAYDGVKWKLDTDYSSIFIVRTFVVHPSYLKIGVGRTLIDFSFELAQKSGMRSVFLPTKKGNKYGGKTFLDLTSKQYLTKDEKYYYCSQGYASSNSCDADMCTFNIGYPSFCLSIIIIFATF